MMISPSLPSIFLSCFFLLSTIHGVKSSFVSCSVSNTIPSQSNINQLLSSLSSKALSNNGFYNDTIGTGTDRVYGLAMCFSYSNSSDCQNCLTLASKEINAYCSNGSDVSIIYDSCLMHYASKNFFSIADTSSMQCSQDRANLSGLITPNKVKNSVLNLMYGLEANARRSSLKFATEEANYTNNQTLSGTVQCTRDLLANECNKCVNDELDFLTRCTNWTTSGVSIVSPSCIVKYELDLSTLSPPQNSAGHLRSNLNMILIIITICIAASLLQSRAGMEL